MKFYILTQIEERNPSIYANKMIVRANSEAIARAIAQHKEDSERGGLLNWGEKEATYEILHKDGQQEVILCV